MNREELELLRKKEMIENLQFALERYRINDGQQCIINVKDLQKILIGYMEEIKENQELRRKIGVYRSYKDCDEEFEI